MGAMLVRRAPASAAVVRRELDADLADHGVCSDRVDDITLVASELVGNAVRHADLSPGGDLDVSWTISANVVWLSVSDASDEQPRVRVAASDEPCGRGLSIVEQLATSWGVDRLPGGGKRVWARLPLAASA